MLEILGLHTAGITSVIGVIEPVPLWNYVPLTLLNLLFLKMIKIKIEIKTVNFTGVFEIGVIRGNVKCVWIDAQTTPTKGGLETESRFIRVDVNSEFGKSALKEFRKPFKSLPTR